MYWQLLAHLLTRDDHEVDGLEVEWGLRGKIFVNDKGVNTVNGVIATECYEYSYDHTCWMDGPFDCVNKPKYGCQEQVTIAGHSCSLCHQLNRQVSDPTGLNSI